MSIRNFLSAVYIVKNGSDLFRRSLESVVRISDEIIVIDSGSTDDTIAIAKAFGAHVVHHPWQGYGAQRQFAIESATHDCILMLDADEVLREEGANATLNALPKVRQGVAFSMRRYNYIGNHLIRHGDWARDSVVRLFHRDYGCFHAADVVHEQWYPTGPVEEIAGFAINHFPFSSYAGMLIKLAKYSELNAEKVYTRGRPVPAHAPMSHALAAFLRTYVLRLGVLDGMDGAAIAWTTALGAFMKYAMARERQQVERR